MNFKYLAIIPLFLAACLGGDDKVTSPAEPVLSTTAHEESNLIWDGRDGLSVDAKWKLLSISDEGLEVSWVLDIRNGHMSNKYEMSVTRFIFKDIEEFQLVEYTNMPADLWSIELEPNSSVTHQGVNIIGVTDVDRANSISILEVQAEIETVAPQPTGAGTPITADNVGQVQAAVFTTASTAFAKGPGKHDGAVSGTVEVKLNTGKLAQIDIGDLGGLGGLAALNYALKFDNFSDDGKIWLDGTVDLSVEAPNFSYKADLDISGDFDGDLKGEVSIQNGVASGFWTVNGQRIDF